MAKSLTENFFFSWHLFADVTSVQNRSMKHARAYWIWLYEFTSYVIKQIKFLIGWTMHPLKQIVWIYSASFQILLLYIHTWIVSSEIPSVCDNRWRFAGERYCAWLNVFSNSCRWQKVNWVFLLFAFPFLSCCNGVPCCFKSVIYEHNQELICTCTCLYFVTPLVWDTFDSSYILGCKLIVWNAVMYASRNPWPIY